MRHHPCPQASVNISGAIRAQLIKGVFASNFEKEEWEITEEAIEEWTRRHNPEALATVGYGGYQWKKLFLPSGTVLRTVFCGKNYFCTVDDDRIVYKEQSVSPSGFVNAVGGIRRNAWRCLWILFPDTKQWALADTLRPSVRRRAVRGASVVPNPVAAAARSEPCELAEAPPEHAPCDAAAGHARQLPGAGASPAGRTLIRPAVRYERCMNGGDALAALFRQELLPLLNRLIDSRANATASGSGP
jgi:hypothetical protein